MSGLLLASAAGAFAHEVSSGPMLLALPVAALAGAASFASPCVLPLVPGYLSYVTGLSGQDLAAGGGGIAVTVGPGIAAVARPVLRVPRVLVGSVLFVLGFSFVFVSYGLAFGALGAALVAHQGLLSRILGGVTIVFGLAFAGLVPALNRQWRPARSPALGLAGAPLLGVLFGLGWTPCIGPTLGAVQTLAATSASADRGALLAFAYCLGLGLPFVLAGLAFRRALGVFAWVRRHYAWVMRLGGAMLVVIGVLLVTGVWTHLTIDARLWFPGYTASI